MKKHIVRQEDEMDCGACCLASIIKYFDGNVPLEQIRIDTYTNQNGTNFFHLKEAGQKYGFNVKGTKVNELKSARTPCIAQIVRNNINHFVVIYEIDDVITLMDPKNGLVKMAKEEFNMLFNGFILEFIPNGNIIRYERTKRFQKLLKAIFKDNLKLFIILLLLCIPIIVLTLISGFNIILILKHHLISLVLILAVANIILNYLKDWFVSSLNQRVNLKIIKEYVAHILNLPLNYLQLRKVGDLTNRISDLHAMKDFFSKIIIEVIINTIIFIGTIIIILIINPKLSILIFIISLIYIFISYKLNQNIYYKVRKIIDSDNHFMDLMIEYLTKIKTIKNLSPDYFTGNLHQSITSTLANKYKLDQRINHINLFRSIVEEGMFLIIILYGYYFKWGYLDIILYITIYNYYLGTIKYFINLMPSIMYFKGVINSITGIFDYQNNIVTSKPKSALKDIKITNLTYSYNQLNNIHENLNISITKGNKVLLQGNNGTGKTTLFDLMAGNIIIPQILVEGKVSYINQDASIFNGTILENIILENKYDKKRFKKVEMITCLKEIIENKPSGYNTHIYLSNISGGERQRIILARHLYREFDVLLMDEALSEVSQSKRIEILNSVFNQYKKQTIIHISHNHDLIRYNQIINLSARKDNYVNE